MVMDEQKREKDPLAPMNFIELDDSLRFLSLREIILIDQLLSSVGSFGEVRLTVKDGRLRFAASTKSYDALKWDHLEVDAEG